ncbi:hypothetical protein ACYJ2U_001836 [Clostridium botulinum]
MNKENFLNYEKYIILVNNTVIEIEAKNKKDAIEKFEDNHKQLFNMDWSIKKVQLGIKINDTINYY